MGWLSQAPPGGVCRVRSKEGRSDGSPPWPWRTVGWCCSWTCRQHRYGQWPVLDGSWCHKWPIIFFKYEANLTLISRNPLCQCVHRWREKSGVGGSLGYKLHVVFLLSHQAIIQPLMCWAQLSTCTTSCLSIEVDIGKGVSFCKLRGKRLWSHTIFLHIHQSSCFYHWAQWYVLTESPWKSIIMILCTQQYLIAVKQ